MGALIFFNSCSTLSLTHLTSLKNLYPYGLLGDDYGILTLEDMAVNACIGNEGPWGSGNLAYPYWQCFPVKDVSVECDDVGYNEDEKSILSILAFVVKSNKESHEYLSKKAITQALCKDFQFDLKKLTQNEEHVCLAGEFTDFYTREYGEAAPVKTESWSFERFKTKKGYNSASTYDLKHYIKNRCKPKIPSG